MLRLPRVSSACPTSLVLGVQKVLGPVFVRDLSSSRFSGRQRVRKTSGAVKEASEAPWSLLIMAGSKKLKRLCGGSLEGGVVA